MSIEIPGKTISFISPDPPNKSVRNNGEQERNLARKEEASTAHADKINVTPMADKLNRLISTASTEPVTDTHRVNAIKQDIEQGLYTVNIGRVAEKFFRFESALHR